MASGPGGKSRLFVQALDGTAPVQLGPDGLMVASPSRAVSPDGQSVAAIRSDAEAGPVLVDVQTGAIRPIPGLSPKDRPLSWSSDGASLFVRESEINSSPTAEPVKIVKLEVLTGKKTPWKEIRLPASGSGVSAIIFNLVLSADGRACFYTVFRGSSDLYLVEGLR